MVGVSDLTESTQIFGCDKTNGVYSGKCPRVHCEASLAKGVRTMSDDSGKSVEGEEQVADNGPEVQETPEGTDLTKSKEDMVKEGQVTITVSKRMARIGALILAGFVGFIIGVVGAGVLHHVHGGPDGHGGRGPGHMRMDNDDRGRFGPGPGMMPGGGQGQGFGPDDQRGPGMMSPDQNDQRGPGMMPGGPQDRGTATPAAPTN